MPIVRFHETGGPEVLKIEDLPLAQPCEGEVRPNVEAIGQKGKIVVTV